MKRQAGDRRRRGRGGRQGEDDEGRTTPTCYQSKRDEEDDVDYIHPLPLLIRNGMIRVNHLRKTTIEIMARLLFRREE